MIHLSLSLRAIFPENGRETGLEKWERALQSLGAGAGFSCARI
jgi:hypothetical protein